MGTHRAGTARAVIPPAVIRRAVRAVPAVPVRPRGPVRRRVPVRPPAPARAAQAPRAPVRPARRARPVPRPRAVRVGTARAVIPRAGTKSPRRRCWCCSAPPPPRWPRAAAWPRRTKPHTLSSTGERAASGPPFFCAVRAQRERGHLEATTCPSSLRAECPGSPGCLPDTKNPAAANRAGLSF